MLGTRLDLQAQQVHPRGTDRLKQRPAHADLRLGPQHRRRGVVDLDAHANILACLREALGAMSG